MSYSFDGAGDNLRGQFGTTYNSVPVTLACFVKVTAHPVAADCLLQFGETDSSVDHALIIRTDTNDDGWVALSDAGATAAGATLPSINVDGVWAGVVGVFTNDALRDIYVQAVTNTAQNTGNQPVNDALSFIVVGETFAGSQDFTGLLAEIAIWNTALDSSQITSYMGGLAASQIAPANLIGYWPLSVSNATQSNEGVDTGGDLAVTNAVFNADHPIISLGSVAKSTKNRLMLGVG